MDGFDFDDPPPIDGVQSASLLPVYTALLVTVAAVAITTRFLSGQRAYCKDGTWTASTPRYWLPFLGHIPQMAWNMEGYLSRMRDKFPRGVFSLQLLGKVHTFVHRPSMAIMLMNKPAEVADHEWLSERLLTSNFGFSAKDRDLYQKALPDIHAQYKHLVGGPGLTDAVKTTVSQLKVHIADFVTFNSYPADQMEWERLAEADVVEGPSGEKFVEANLMELVKSFVARTANPSLFGSDFAENFPDLPQCVSEFDDGYLLMAMKLPLPWPRLQKARRARSKALSYLREFHVALDKELEGEDPGARWQDLDNVSQLVLSRTEVFRKAGLSVDGRAAADLMLVWAMNANSSPLVFWMLYEICRDPVLLEQIREEVAPHVRAVQPTNNFGPGVWLQAVMETLDAEALAGPGCPLLRSAYVETMRVYTGAWSVKWIQEDTLLKESGKGGESFLLKEGTYAHVPQAVHQLDPRFFPEPQEWQGGRHVKETVDEKGKKVLGADLGTIRPFGGGQSICKGRNFALRELLMFTAAIITMYDIQPANGGQWTRPKTAKHSTTRHPTKPVQVWIKRRNVPEED